MGKLAYFRIWTDGTSGGHSASWFLQEAILHDVGTKETFTFVCESWLAIDRGDFTLEKLFEVTPKTEAQGFRRVFSLSTKVEIRDQHLWLSILSKPAQSAFTRVQRWSCCLSVLFTSMIASAMWFGTVEESDSRGQAVKFGPIVLSTKEVYVAAMATLVIFPINFIIIQLFRKSVPRRNPYASKKERQRERINKRQKLYPSKIRPCSESEGNDWAEGYNNLHRSGRISARDIDLHVPDHEGHVEKRDSISKEELQCSITLLVCLCGLGPMFPIYNSVCILRHPLQRGVGQRQVRRMADC